MHKVLHSIAEEDGRRVSKIHDVFLSLFLFTLLVIVHPLQVIPVRFLMISDWTYFSLRCRSPAKELCNSTFAVSSASMRIKKKSKFDYANVSVPMLP